MSRMRATWVLIVVAACGNDSQPTRERRVTPDASARACKHAPECFPAQDTPGLTCSVAGELFTCDHCGDRGGLMKCKDIDGDGCLDLVRTECGRPDGCEVVAEVGARCKRIEESQDRFGALTPGQALPAGFIECTGADTVFPVADDKLVLVARTRAVFENPITWSVALVGAGLTIPPDEQPAQFLDIDDTWVDVTRTLDVTGFDDQAHDVAITFTLKDQLQSIAMTCNNVTLKRVGS